MSKVEPGGQAIKRQQEICKCGQSEEERFLFLVDAGDCPPAGDLPLEINTDSEKEDPENAETDAVRNFSVRYHDILSLFPFVNEIIPGHSRAANGTPGSVSGAMACPLRSSGVLGSSTVPGCPISNRIRTNRFHCAASDHQARDYGFRLEVVRVAMRTQDDQLLQIDRQSPPRVRL